MTPSTLRRSYYAMIVLLAFTTYARTLTVGFLWTIT
jgi:hypothetical protein